jgi:hypothetical protein
MAEKANSKTVTLVDGTTLQVQPLKISLLRPFVKRFGDLALVADDNDKSMDVLLDCVQIAMKQYKPELSENKESLEDLLDLPTVYEIIEAASGSDAATNNNLIATISK